MATSLNRLLVIIVLFSTLTSQVTPLNGASPSIIPQAQLEQITSVDFTWYKFLIVGNSINFTAKAIGGTSPFTYDWNFGDGQQSSVTTPSLLHTYILAGNYTVSLTVTDSEIPPSSQSTSRDITVLSWPTNYNGWTVRHNITENDGVVLWDVTYNGRLVIKDARLTGIRVMYKDAYPCLFYDEFLSQYTDVGIFEYSSSGNDPYLQIRTKSIDWPWSLVGGYWYQQVWRFYASGRWDAEVWLENGGGCGPEHLYNPHWRFDLGLGNGAGEFVSAYMPSGKWRNLLWEGNYTDNGIRDQAHNASQWRFSGAQTSYYIRPEISRVSPNQYLPTIAPRIYLVKSKPGEIEIPPNALSNYQNPMRWVNPGELSFNRDLAFWLLGYCWVRGPLVHVPGNPGNTVTVSFYPDGL